MYETLRKEVDWEHNHPAGLMLILQHLMIQEIMFMSLIFGNQKRS
jgi:hypothetical protein